MSRPEPTTADITSALALVIDLAAQNIIDQYDNPTEYRRQSAALKLVRETFGKPGELR